MKRRNFLALMGGLAVASPWDAWAQQERTVKVGLLYPGPLAAANSRAETLREMPTSVLLRADEVIE